MALTQPQGNMMMKLAAEQASTSGSSLDFTGIPAGTTMIVLMFSGLSTNNATSVLWFLGSGSMDTGSTYNYRVGYGNNGSVVGTVALDSQAGGYLSVGNNAADLHHGMAIFVLEDASDNTWSMVCNSGCSSSGYFTSAAGTKSLSGTLDRIRLSVTGTLDAGAVSIAYF